MVRRETAAEVVVAGAGMAGLAAGAIASQRGCAVAVIEKGTSPGGSMALSGGTIWTYDTAERASEAAPRGDSALQAAVVEGLERGIDWLDSLGVSMEPLEKEGGWGVTLETGELTSALVATIERNGGTVRTNAPLSGLDTESGSVTGVCTSSARSDSRGGDPTSADADPDRIPADAVVLATGGFQGNPDLVERHVTDRTDRLWLRANPDSTGDGVLAARDVGAASTPGSGWFYGHNMAAPPADVNPDTFVEVTQYYGPWAVAVDSNGRRFVDESSCDDESELAVATARRADGRAYYVIDAERYDSAISATLDVGEIVEQTRERGGPVVSADSLDAIPDAVADWQLNGTALLDTVESFNDACRNDRPLTPPRARRREPLDEPPFHVVAVQPGITTSTGGLAVDESMRAIDRSSSHSPLPRTRSEGEANRAIPIEGLFAAGADVGNVHNGGYIGGLATGLVTGRIAGSEAAEFVSAPETAE